MDQNVAPIGKKPCIAVCVADRNRCDNSFLLCGPGCSIADAGSLRYRLQHRNMALDRHRRPKRNLVYIFRRIQTVHGDSEADHIKIGKLLINRSSAVGTVFDRDLDPNAGKIVNKFSKS